MSFEVVDMHNSTCNTGRPMLGESMHFCSIHMPPRPWALQWYQPSMLTEYCSGPEGAWSALFGVQSSTAMLSIHLQSVICMLTPGAHYKAANCPVVMMNRPWNLGLLLLLLGF